MQHRRPAVLAGIIALLVPAAAAAQIDYRNLDDDRPVRAEDAYALERYAFEFLAPYRFGREPGGTSRHAFIPELEYGLMSNAQIGLKLPVAGLDGAGPTRWGLTGVRVFALYNFNTESPVLPAFALRTDVHLPAGSLGGDATRVSLKGIATRSFGRTRVHLNGAWGFGRDGVQPAAEGLERWWYGAAVDRTLFRRSTLVVGEIYALRATDAARVQVNAALGLRYQWTPMTVLDFGLARGVRNGLGPSLEVTFGVSRAFAVPWLMPRRGSVSTPTSGGTGDHRH